MLSVIDLFDESVTTVDGTVVGLDSDNDLVIVDEGGNVIVISNVTATVRALRKAELIQAEREATAERLANASEPIDQPTRSALFAALTETYGKLNDERRLSVVSRLAGRNIWSMSQRGNMTMGDAHRVLDALSTLREARV